jgi:hypothetical protein
MHRGASGTLKISELDDGNWRIHRATRGIVVDTDVLHGLRRFGD